MPQLLFAWECAVAPGQVANYRALLASLGQQGHQVAVALRDLSAARSLIAPPQPLSPKPAQQLQVWQSPFVTAPGPDAASSPANYLQLLSRLGFPDAKSLLGRVAAWRNLFRLCKPAVVFAQHAPTALLALRGSGCPHVIVGTPWECPPLAGDWHPLHPLLPHEQQIYSRQQTEVVAGLNQVLRKFRAPALQKISDLFEEAQATVVCSGPELDCYPRPNREAGHTVHWGPLPTGGDVPTWPAGPGKKLLAELTGVPLEPLIQAVQLLEIPTVLLLPGVRPEFCQRWSRELVHCIGGPVDWAATAQACDLFIGNGNHHETQQMLLAGKPVLAWPTTVEQQITAHRVEKLGVGVQVAAGRPQDLLPKLTALYNTARYAERAREFAARQAPVDRPQQLQKWTELCAKLAAKVKI